MGFDIQGECAGCERVAGEGDSKGVKGVRSRGYDPLLSKEEIGRFGVKAFDNLDVKLKMNGVIVAVSHDEFKNKSFLSTGSFFRKKVFCAS